jgi:hypothetical protein
VSFAVITLSVASQRVIRKVNVYFFIIQSGNFWIHPRISTQTRLQNSIPLRPTIEVQFFHKMWEDQQEQKWRRDSLKTLKHTIRNSTCGLYGCENCCLTRREEHSLRQFVNWVLRRKYGPKREEMMGDWGRLHMPSFVTCKLHLVFSG